MRYGAILLDPPWSFKTYSAKGITSRSPDSKYQVANIEQLKMLPMREYAADNCVMFMWVIDSHLDQGMDLMEAYGFRFKTIAFCWVKTGKNGQPSMSLGLWTRKGMEICLLGTKGKPARKGKGVRQVIMSPRREHSRKPDEIYGRIENLVDGPYAEAFSRQPWPGWDQIISNESKKFAQIERFTPSNLIQFGQTMR